MWHLFDYARGRLELAPGRLEFALDFATKHYATKRHNKTVQEDAEQKTKQTHRIQAVQQESSGTIQRNKTLHQSYLTETTRHDT